MSIPETRGFRLNSLSNYRNTRLRAYLRATGSTIPGPADHKGHPTILPVTEHAVAVLPVMLTCTSMHPRSRGCLTAHSFFLFGLSFWRTDLPLVLVNLIRLPVHASYPPAAW